MGGTSFSIYLLFPPWIQKKISASPKPEGLTGYVIIYARRMYPENLTGVSDAFLVFGFKQPLEEVWAAEGVVPTAMADTR